MQEKEDVRLKEPKGPTKKIVTPVTGNPGMGNKKVSFIPMHPIIIIIEEH